jgi:tRNA modification GTPase
MLKQDTIAAIATPPGEGGIAVVRVSGPEALGVAVRVFRPQKGGDPRRFPGYSVHYGAFVERTGAVADDGLLTVFRAPHSYTGEDTVELSCHGGRATTARILQLTLDAGARLAEPGEFTLRAFLNGRLDLAQAEAVADVIRARTETARRVARRQLDGALSRAVAALKDELVGILAAIEVTIDFSEEVGELEYAPLEARLKTVREGVERLLATAEQGRILREGLRAAIVGRPNVGKSSLLNALLRAERAIVTPIAGTTRDLVEESANVRGVPVVFIDTAGMRETTDLVERIGVERAEGAASVCDVALLVLDAVAGVTPEDIRIAQRLTGESEDEAEEEAASERLRAGRLLLVINKCDAVSAERVEAVQAEVRRQSGLASRRVVTVSALTGMGLEALEAALVGGSGEAGAAFAETGGVPLAKAEVGTVPDSVVVAGTRHRQALETAYRSLQEAERTAAQRLPGDFIAIDARGALDALGWITGETVTEDIIHRIFHDFCVGK